MRAAILDAPGKVRIYTRSNPGLGPKDVGIEVAYAGICGSDIHMYDGTNKMVTLPQHPGHEFAGIVTARGSEVDINLGKLVAVEPTIGCMTCKPCLNHKRNNCKDFKVIGCATDYGGFAEYIQVPEYLALPVDIDTGPKLAAMIEPASVGVHAARQGGVKENQRVFVMGAGTIGLMAMAASKYLTNNKVQVFASDPIQERLELAQRLGFADRIFVGENPTSELEDLKLYENPDRGFDVVIDAACEEGTLEMGAELALQGTVVDLDVIDRKRDMSRVTRFESTVIGSRTCNGTDFQDAYQMIKDTALKDLLDQDLGQTKAIKVFNTLDELPEAYAAAQRREFLKCLVKIN